MGLLDSLFDAVESGALEKRLNQFADTVDKTTKKAERKLQVAADKPGKVIDAAQGKATTAKSKVPKSATQKPATPRKPKVAPKQTGIHMDIIRKKR